MQCSQCGNYSSINIYWSSYLVIWHQTRIKTNWLLSVLRQVGNISCSYIKARHEQKENLKTRDRCIDWQVTEFGLMTKTKNSEGSQAVGLLNCCTDVSRRANIYIHNCYRNNIILLKNKARSFKSTKQNKIRKFRIIDIFFKVVVLISSGVTVWPPSSTIDIAYVNV